MRWWCGRSRVGAEGKRKRALHILCKCVATARVPIFDAKFDLVNFVYGAGGHQRAGVLKWSRTPAIVA